MFTKSGAAMKVFLLVGLAALITLVFASAMTLADRIYLNDGTVLEGTVIKNGDKYWFKGADGTSRMIPSNQVTKVESGSAPKAADASAGGSTNFIATKAKAERVNTPLAAVTIWQDFIDNTTNADDLAKAREEMERWQKMADDGAERIKGKWVTGEERKAIRDKAAKLLHEAEAAMENNKTFIAIDKLKQAQAIYPNDYDVNYLLGTITAVTSRDFDAAIRYFSSAQKIRPNSAGAMANIGICMCAKQKYQEGLKTIFRASKIEDSPALAKSLIVAISMAPPSVRRSSAMKEVVAQALLLAARYDINPNESPTTYYLVPPDKDTDEDGSEGDSLLERGMISSGTGFLINDQGLILTNHHVVNGATTFLVVLNSTDRRSAELVAVGDEDTDLALLRIKPRAGEKLPYLKLAKYDHPSGGADVYVMGYPLIDRLGGDIKMTRGIVSSANEHATGGADTQVDAKVNPGNSGGPMLDKYGNVMAVVCLKSISSSTEESYGFGISTGNVRPFLAAQKVELTPGDESGGKLDSDVIFDKAKMATVCILATHDGN